VTDSPPPGRSPFQEPAITINGVALDTAQSMTVRVAVMNMEMELQEPDHMAALGQVGTLYQARLREVIHLMVKP
jgi:hypothetical protein